MTAPKGAATPGANPDLVAASALEADLAAATAALEESTEFWGSYDVVEADAAAPASAEADVFEVLLSLAWDELSPLLPEEPDPLDPPEPPLPPAAASILVYQGILVA